MKNIKKPTVAVISGGIGMEHDISVLGKNYVLSRIDRSRFSVLDIFIDRGGEWYLEEKSGRNIVHPIRKNGRAGFLSGSRFYPVAAAFPILHGDFGEDGRIQGLLECIGMPFVGCKTVTGAVAADKCFTKAVAESIGIPTVPWTAVNGVPDGERIKEIEDTLSYPIFVKPARLGSSVGAGIAHDRAELCSLLSAAGELGDGRVIAERCLRSPRELECAMLDTARGRIFTFPAEVRTEGEFYSFEEKYSSTSSAKLALRAEITEKTAECIKDYAKALADALGLEGISRIDFFLDGDDIYFNEVNTMPGLTESSLYPGLMEAKEESADFVNLLLESAVGASL